MNSICIHHIFWLIPSKSGTKFLMYPSSHGLSPTTMTSHYNPKHYGLHSGYPQNLANGSSNTNPMATIMYSSYWTCVCASKWVVDLFSFVSLLWMYRRSTHSPADSWPVQRQVFTQQCCSKAPIQAHRHTGVHMHKHEHSLPSIVSSFHMLKNTHTQHPAHNPLPQSARCNIPVSHPGLSNDDITQPRETGTLFTRYEVAWWVEPLSPMDTYKNTILSKWNILQDIKK